MISNINWAVIILLGAYSTISMSQNLYPPSLVNRLKDSDQDGVINARDFCANTEQSSDIDNHGCSLTKLTVYRFNFDLQFETGKYRLKAQSHSKLQHLADFLQQAPETLLLIEGYTDNVGIESYNLALSKKRAKSIANALISKFDIAPSRIKTFGYGQDNPIASNSTEAGRKANRRVNGDIIIPFQYEQQNKTLLHVDNVDLTILFGQNRYGIKTDYRPAIQNIGKLLQQDPETLVLIEGHTDNTGSKQYNLALSMERANNIANFLNTQYAISPTRLKVLGHGQESPITSNTTPGGREINRRVDIKVMTQFKAKQEVILPKWTIWNIGKIEKE